VIEKPISVHLFVPGEEETSSIRLMNRSLYRLTPVRTELVARLVKFVNGCEAATDDVAFKRSYFTKVSNIENTRIEKKDGKKCMTEEEKKDKVIKDVMRQKRYKLLC